MQNLHSRPSWDEHGLNKAWVESLRSTCRIKVGAAVTTSDTHRSLVSGYAGSLPGQPHCCDVGCEFHWVAPPYAPTLVVEDSGTYVQARKSCQRTIHAEANCFAVAASEGIPLRGATWYTVPFAPCATCAKLLIASGAHRVVYPEPPKGYEHYRESPLLVAAGLDVLIVADWQPPVVET